MSNAAKPCYPIHGHSLQTLASWELGSGSELLTLAHRWPDSRTPRKHFAFKSVFHRARCGHLRGADELKERLLAAEHHLLSFGFGRASAHPLVLHTSGVGHSTAHVTQTITLSGRPRPCLSRPSRARGQRQARWRTPLRSHRSRSTYWRSEEHTS